MMNINKKEILDITLNKGWFFGLSQSEIIRLLERSSVESYAAEETVYGIGEIQENVYCVIEGLIKVSIANKNGDSFPLTLWESGNWFGESAFSRESPMPLAVTSIENTRILSIPISEIDAVLDNSAVFYKNIIQDMLERSHLLYKLIEMLLFDTLQARVAARILHLVELFGQASSEGIVLPLTLNQSDLATMSGGSRQRVNMIFRNWSSQGILSKQNKWYVIHDVQALEAELAS